MPASKPLEPNFWIAYSGGLDSHVLLHLLVTKALRENNFYFFSESCLSAASLASYKSKSYFPVELYKAVHIHHNLSPHADAWAEHCRKTCEDLGVEYHCIHVNAHPAPGQSPEAAAREARYSAFATLLKPGDHLLTAHHQDDQAETLLLQLFRGAGIKGLAVMPKISPFAQGYLMRPLLEMQRHELLTYAKEKNLKWIEDESNSNTDFDRNYVRHHVMPVIHNRWPAITPVLGRVAKHCAEANELLDKLAEETLQSFTPFVKGGRRQQAAGGFFLPIKQLLTLSDSEQNNLLRYWFRSLGFPIPSATQLQHLKTDILYSQPKACPLLHWPGVNIRRYRDTLYALPDQPAWVPPDSPIPWNLEYPLTLPDGRVLTTERKTAVGIQISAETIVEVRFRQNGERCQPVGRQGSHPLKKLFQEWGAPPWERDAVPLLYLNDQLIVVVGYCVCKPAMGLIIKITERSPA